jgi:hypothetical protein
LNRLAWINSHADPLVEEIYLPQKDVGSLQIVLSYLPWQKQLGRCAVADELLLRLLAEAARPRQEVLSLDDRWCLLYPATGQIKPDLRPVLAAALKWAEAADGEQGADRKAAGRRYARGYVLDFRGGRPPADLMHRLDAKRKIEPLVDKASPLLILGDSPILDSWNWLKLDRSEHRSDRPGVIWWPDTSLPPSLAAELRLMQLFTEWNVFVGKTPPGE